MSAYCYLIVALVMVACDPTPPRSEQQIVMEVNGEDTVWRALDYHIPTKQDSIIAQYHYDIPLYEYDDDTNATGRFCMGSVTMTKYMDLRVEIDIDTLSKLMWADTSKNY